tara:strand:+ start:723 stop:884 length:162 start_codon:yes stop_codon:yes gene_type:complete
MRGDNSQRDAPYRANYCTYMVRVAPSGKEQFQNVSLRRYPGQALAQGQNDLSL